MVDAAQIDQACRLAEAAFDPFRASSPTKHAPPSSKPSPPQILEIGDALIVRAMAESGLPRARLEGERGRTDRSAQTVRRSAARRFVGRRARIDSALPDRAAGLPRPDLRLRMIGLGPVAVFAASNFPLAFSVAGGDTAAALAAGCPVVLKAHSAHPGTSELVARAVVQSGRTQCNLPVGTCSRC